MQQVFELYAIRQEMEGLVAPFAAQHATEVEIDNLVRINNEFGAATDPRRAAEFNRVFHARLYRCSPQSLSAHGGGGIAGDHRTLPLTTFVAPGRIEVAHGEHVRIIEAIRNRDVAAAQEAGAEHIRKALSTRLSISDS